MSIFIILRRPVAISVTVYLILIKLTNDSFILYIQKINRALAKQMMQLQWKYNIEPNKFIFGLKQYFCVSKWTRVVYYGGSKSLFKILSE